MLSDLAAAARDLAFHGSAVAKNATLLEILADSIFLQGDRPWPPTPKPPEPDRELKI
jgi:hypothetical protein